MPVRKSIEIPRDALRRLFVQRCFYLFILLLALITVSPFMVLAVAAAVGRTVLSFLAVFCLVAGAVALRYASLENGQMALFNWALLLHAIVYLSVIGLMLRYVFGPEVMDADRLWGAASVYLLLGVLWCFVYALTEIAVDVAFLVRGEPARLELTDLLYFSFSTLTTIGFGDIVPVTRTGQIAAILEGIVGTLFLAILIAKLVGVYPPPQQTAAQEPSSPE